jgi:putative hemolysin
MCQKHGGVSERNSHGRISHCSLADGQLASERSLSRDCLGKDAVKFRVAESHVPATT